MPVSRITFCGCEIKGNRSVTIKIDKKIKLFVSQQHPANRVLLPMQGFGPEAPRVYIQKQRIFVEKVRNVFVMGEKFSI